MGNRPYPSNDGPDLEDDLDDDLDDDLGADADASYRVTASELRGFIERVERIGSDMDDLREAQREVYAEARGRGYDVKAMRKLVAERKRDREELREQEAILQLYREALGDI